MSEFLKMPAGKNHTGVHAGERRLVFINRFFYPDLSATSQILSDLVFALALENFEVQVIASRQRREGNEAKAPTAENLRGVSVHRITIPDLARLGLVGRAMEYAAFYLGAATALRRVVHPGDIVVAKTDPPLISVLAAIVSWRKDAKLVNWLQDIYPEVARRLNVPVVRGLLGVVLVRLRDAALKSAAADVAIGECMAEFIASRGVEAAKIRVIPNWADDEAIKPVPAARNPLREQFGLQNAFIVGYSGNLGRAHEFETLLGAVDLLRNQKGLVFLFIGGGYHVDALRARVRSQGLDDLFMFLSAQPRSGLANSLSLPDVHWLSLRPELEGLIVPSKFYGIAAAGRPVISITAKDGEIARVVREHNCGLVVEPGQSSTLASEIMRLRADRSLCDHMGKSARALIEARFSRRQALKAWSELFSAQDIRSSYDLSNP